MARRKKSPPSLYAFVEETARFLRSASRPKKVKRKVTKDDGLSNTNKICQIASMLRSEAKKKISKEKKKG